MAEASQKIIENPIALELRRLQMLTEIGAENNTTTLTMMPSEFITPARDLKAPLQPKNQQNLPQPWDISVDSFKNNPKEVDNT